MRFYEIVHELQTIALLQREGRVSYRALKREFALDDEFLEDLKEELIAVKALAVDEDGKMLVWVGAGAVGEKGEMAKGIRKTPKTRTRPMDTYSPRRTHPCSQCNRW